MCDCHVCQTRIRCLTEGLEREEDRYDRLDEAFLAVTDERDRARRVALALWHGQVSPDSRPTLVLRHPWLEPDYVPEEIDV